MPRRGSKRKKTRTHQGDAPVGATVLTAQGSQEALNKEQSDIPRSIVAKGSKVIPQVGELVRDLRKLMDPHTAKNLREKNYNRMKDYSDVAVQLGVSHLLTITQTTRNIVLRIGRTPTGPTLHFRIARYSLARQVRAAQKRPFESPAAFMTPPLVVLNNFGQAEEHHVKLMRVTFQNMFPSINVKTVRLNDCRRVVLFHYRKEDGLVDMRHFAIRAAPVGISRNIKKILQARIPNLGDLQDISQFLQGGDDDEHGGGAASGVFGGDAVSDSEGEDASARVVLPDQYIGRGNGKAQQSAMKLSELGPRLRLEIFKVERGVGEGDVLYHKYEQKTPEEAAATKARVERLRKLKEERKATQAENVKRKRELLEEKRKTKADAKRAKYETAGRSDADADNEGEDDDDDNDEDDEEDEDEGRGMGEEADAAYSDSEVDEDMLDESEEEEEEEEEEKKTER